MKKFQSNLKPNPSVSARTLLMMQNVFNPPQTAPCPSETQIAANPCSLVENCDNNSLILNIPEVTDGIILENFDLENYVFPVTMHGNFSYLVYPIGLLLILIFFLFCRC